MTNDWSDESSDVALLAFFTSLSTAASMAQQLHTCFRWTTIQLEQFDYVKINIENPELSIAGASVGLDLVLFYIREYSPSCIDVHTVTNSLADTSGRILLLQCRIHTCRIMVRRHTNPCLPWVSMTFTMSF